MIYFQNIQCHQRISFVCQTSYNRHFREITLQNLVHDSLPDPATFLGGQLEGFNTFPILRVIARQFLIKKCNDFCEYSLEQDRSGS
jgi:hypothetical protein